MSARKRPEIGETFDGPVTRTPPSPEEATSSAEVSGPEQAGPWGWGGGIDEPAPWGVGEDSPMNEGSEQTAVQEGRRGERRAGTGGEPTPKAGRHGFGPVEPTRVTEAGPGAPPDPAPAHRPFPDPVPPDIADNSLERQTGMRTRRTSRARGA